jgi:hypothetical protein
VPSHHRDVAKEDLESVVPDAVELNLASDRSAVAAGGDADQLVAASDALENVGLLDAVAVYHLYLPLPVHPGTIDAPRRPGRIDGPRRARGLEHLGHEGAGIVAEDLANVHASVLERDPAGLGELHHHLGGCLDGLGSG